MPSAIVALGATTPADGRAGCPDLEPRIRAPSRFVEGLAGAWVPMEARDCLYIVGARMTRPSPVFRAPAGRRMRGPVWSPTKPEVAVAYRTVRSFEVAVPEGVDFFVAVRGEGSTPTHFSGVAGIYAFFKAYYKRRGWPGQARP